MRDLYNTTIELVRKSDRPLTQIAADAKVGHRWLSGLMAGRYTDPGVKKIQRLYDNLSKPKKGSAA